MSLPGLRGVPAITPQPLSSLTPEAPCLQNPPYPKTEWEKRKLQDPLFYGARRPAGCADHCTEPTLRTSVAIFPHNPDTSSQSLAFATPPKASMRLLQTNTPWPNALQIAFIFVSMNGKFFRRLTKSWQFSSTSQVLPRAHLLEVNSGFSRASGMCALQFSFFSICTVGFFSASLVHSRPWVLPPRLPLNGL